MTYNVNLSITKNDKYLLHATTVKAHGRNEAVKKAKNEFYNSVMFEYTFNPEDKYDIKVEGVWG